MRRQRGFTLLEVLGALALLALLLVAVYGGVRSAIHGVRSGSAAINRIEEIGSVQRFLRSELSQAVTQPIARTDNGQPIYFSGSEHEMRYVAPLPGYLGKLGSQLQVLRLVDGDKGEQRLELQLSLLPPDGQPPKPLGDPQVLLDHIEKGSFDYRGRDALNHEQPWSSDWTDGRRLPQLVRIRLQAQGGYDWPELSVPLRVDAAGAGGHVGLLPGSIPMGGAQ